MTHDMRKIRSAAGRQPAYLNAFSTLTRFPRTEKDNRFNFFKNK